MDEVKPVVLPGLEAAYSNPLEGAQLKSMEARRIFEAVYEADPWMDDYWDLIAEGYSWRQAIYMLWIAQPSDQRQPKTQGELATEILGLASDRAVRDWRNNPAFEARVARLTASVLVKHRAAVFRALADSAANNNPRNHADRRMFLEMTGDYTPKQAVSLGTAANPVADLDEASLVALAGIPNSNLAQVSAQSAAPPSPGFEDDIEDADDRD